MSATEPLPGSERPPLPGAMDMGPCPEGERLEVTLFLRSRDPGGAPAAAREAGRLGRPLDRDDYTSRYGAAPADLDAVAAFAVRHGLAVLERSAPRRSVVLGGTADRFGAAFGVELRHYRHPEGTHRGHAGPVGLAPELRGIVVAVLGLDDRPQARPHLRLRSGPPAPPAAYTPPQVADLYGFPPGTGAGQCVALVEMGGGFRPADLDPYFADLGIAPAPTVVAVSVDHGRNAPTGSASGPDGEVDLDIEVAGSIAPGARYAVYFVPNTDQGFVDAVTAAAHDCVNRPTIISISWGGPESTWTGQAMQALDEAIAGAVALGIPVFVAAGDGGSSDGVDDGLPHVDFPASSPHATACGGTRLLAAGGAIVSEVVWNDGPGGGATGGGVSAVFPVPTWQAGAGVPLGPTGFRGRGVPDVAGDADPETGYAVRVDGQATVVGGTSAVAPLWAALAARLFELGAWAPGLPNPALYADPQALRPVTQGSNGAYSAAPGWNPCTGLGSPNGPVLAQGG